MTKKGRDKARLGITGGLEGGGWVLESGSFCNSWVQIKCVGEGEVGGGQGREWPGRMRRGDVHNTLWLKTPILTIKIRVEQQVNIF